MISIVRAYAQQYLDNSKGEVKGESENAAGTFDRNARVAMYEKEDFESFKKTTHAKTDEVKKLIIDAIKPNVMFKEDTEEEIVELVDVFKPVSYKAGEVVIKQGEEGDEFYVVESGALSILVSVGDGEDKSEVKVGDYSSKSTFGELALIFGSPRAATITATEDCQLWSLNRQAYRGVIGQIRHRELEEKKEIVRSCEISGKRFTEIFDGARLDDLTIALKIDHFAEGEIILREGSKGNTFYIVRSGKVEVTKEGEDSKFFEEKQMFGMEFLLHDAPSNATYTAKSPVAVYYITKGDMSRMVGNLQDAIDGKSNSRITRYTEKRKTTMSTGNKKEKCELNELDFFNVLGQGAFGKVRLVQSKKSKKVFALKALSKSFVVEKKQKEHVLREFNTLNDIEHPNIIKLHCAMQDSKYIYFLTDLLPGGELMDHFLKRGKLTEEMTRFYAASIVLAFEEIHLNTIAYRDLKPENMCLDRNGYCVLVDFGLAKEIDEGQTFTFCGTPDYLAPEIIRGTGHDWGVDYWGLGILLYELTSGVAPFYANNQSRRARKILEGYQLVTPPAHFSGRLNSLIEKLLVADQSSRLGRTQNGVQGIKNHRWFAGFDWQGLLDKKIEVPIKPEVAADIKSLGRPDTTPDNAPVSDWNPVFNSFSY